MLRVVSKLAAKAKDNWNGAPVTVAFLGDSVTQGCYEFFRKNDGNNETVFDKNAAYPTVFSRILAFLYPTVPVNVINAGISGNSAVNGLERIERDVLSHKPDLTVVCFGLNDCGGGDEGLPRYRDALAAIFQKLLAAGSEVIFLTPNTMAREVSCHLLDDGYKKDAAGIVAREARGDLSRYLSAAKEICGKFKIPVCDCHAKWNLLEAGGVNTTELLANYINHPRREMDWLFAYAIVEMMFESTEGGQIS